MISIIQDITTFLSAYKYLFLFSMSLIDGRVPALFAGFMISAKEFLFWPTYFLLIIGNLITDTIYYFIGRKGSNWKIVKRNKDKIDYIESLWKKYAGKVVFFGKLTVIFVVPVLMFFGLIKYPYKKFIKYSIGIDLLIIAILIAIGYFSGHAYKAHSQYIYLASLLIAIIFLVLLFIVNYKYSNNKKNK